MKDQKIEQILKIIFSLWHYLVQLIKKSFSMTIATAQIIATDQPVTSYDNFICSDCS